MMLPKDPNRVRLISVIAATTISIACGTNYVYSAWAPQFAQRLKLSATESNLIGTLANFGMYACGIPFGILIDAKGPRWGVALGIILFCAGYFPLAKAFDAGPGVYSVFTLCLFSFFTGAGSCSAFTAAVKSAAVNYPESRGTATAFPLAAFGLSAFFFATLALALPHDTSHFLQLLAVGTVVLPVVSFFFLQVVPPQVHQQLPQHESRILHQRKSSDDRAQVHSHEASTPPDIHSRVSHHAPEPIQPLEDEDAGDEEASLLSKPSSDEPSDLANSRPREPDRNSESLHLDVRGFALVPLPEFWLLFSLFGLLTGIGLMTINNIGNDAQALWKHYDPDVSDAFIAKKQVMHVSVLSVCSFSGRLLSGIGSDILVIKYDRSRCWCLFVSAMLFAVAQMAALLVQNPNLLILVSGITGVAYGVLFGVSPSLVAHAFGINGLSQNWGTMTLAPVVSGNIFNIFYGWVYDSHSLVEENGDRQCVKGRVCYGAAYWITFASSLGALVLCLWNIYHENETYKKNAREKDRRRSDHDRSARERVG